MAEEQGRHLLAASWNVHGFVGAGARLDPHRTLGLIASWGADVVGLQEAALRPRGALSRGAMARELGLTVIAGPTLLGPRAPFGNLLATRLPVMNVRRHDLSRPGREPRGLLDVDLEAGGRRLRVAVTHLGLAAGERAAQLARLGELLAPRGEDCLLVLGDFNEWWPLRRALRRFLAGFGGPLRPTFPACRPMLPLDRILVRPASRLVRLWSAPRREACRASDHLPLLARIDLGPG